ncbi:hypothetical protein C2138_06065 [Salinibacterium hongtaonis]|nr:hypothetical protein C2138_06065 [Salinibacterium hongtaonis]
MAGIRTLGRGAGSAAIAVVLGTLMAGCSTNDGSVIGADLMTVAGARVAAEAANSEAAIAILEDGEITVEEYESTLGRYEECASEHDRKFTGRVEDPINGHRIYSPYEYWGSPESEFSPEVSACALERDLIELAYINQFDPISDPVILTETRECLVRLGNAVTGNERNFLDFQDDPDLDPAELIDCGAESSFRHWPNIPFSIG